jgi:hypothetical protein
METEIHGPDGHKISFLTIEYRLYHSPLQSVFGHKNFQFYFYSYTAGRYEITMYVRVQSLTVSLSVPWI